MRTILTAAALAASLAGCTWVKMAPGGADVRVARATDDMAACERRGEIAVSVKDRLGPYERNELRVRDELETLARNEAAGLGADTLQPLDEPSAGEQRFAAAGAGLQGFIGAGHADGRGGGVELHPDAAAGEQAGQGGGRGEGQGTAHREVLGKRGEPGVETQAGGDCDPRPPLPAMRAGPRGPAPFMWLAAIGGPDQRSTGLPSASITCTSPSSRARTGASIFDRSPTTTHSRAPGSIWRAEALTSSTVIASLRAW